MCKFCLMGKDNLCEKCKHELRLYRMHATGQVARVDVDLISRIESVCARNSEANAWVPELYILRTTGHDKPVDCIQCGEDFDALGREKTCPKCRAMERRYRNLVSRTKKLLAQGHGAGDAIQHYDKVYARRQERGLTVPRVYLKRMEEKTNGSESN